MRILIGLLEHMGDIIACEPAARYLKAKYGGAQVSWAVRRAYRSLIDSNPYVDETLEVDCLTDWIKLTRHSSYEMIVDLHVNYRICQHCAVPLVKSTGNPAVNAYEWFDYGTLQEALTLGAGLPALCAQPRVYVGSEEASAVDALQLPADYCVIHRESNDVVKDWRQDGWEQLVRWIRHNVGISVIEVGAGTLRSGFALPEGGIDLVNKLTILQTAEVIRRARFFIGVDSGPAHLANALRVPGIVLLGRLGYFRQYMPFNGFFASESPAVKMVRNPAGPVRNVTLAEVIEAVQYVASVARSSNRSTLGNDGAALNVLPPHEFTHSDDERDAILRSGYFDAAWYSVHYTDVEQSGILPIDHFLTMASKEARSPGPDFNAARYLRAYPDVGESGLQALHHYIRHGREEGRKRYAHSQATDALPLSANHTDACNKPELSMEPNPFDAETNFRPRVLAFYLPQFHPIPENDWAHGAGFTEWHNVSRAKPLFRGHHQPRVPGELGYYDLRSPEVLHQQMSLAAEHGIDGFCFYYYYFQGKRLLYKPLAHYLQSDLKAPFCLLWANENWTKRWDGGDSEIIIEQRHSREDDVAFIKGLLPLFEDSRYVKIGGRPLLLIYKAHLFPDIQRSTETWREEAERYGFPGIYLVMADDWVADLSHPRTYGFDATYEIPSNVVPNDVLYTESDTLDLDSQFSGRIIDYAKFAAFHQRRPFPEYKRFRTIMLPWDNTPRYGTRAIVHVNTSGDAYRQWLIDVLLDVSARFAPEERIIFLHSWNEWCEGTYLEPDARFGRMYLEKTKDALQIAEKALAAVQSGTASVHVVAELLQLLQAKNVSAFRQARATQEQIWHLHRELEAAKSGLSDVVADREAVRSEAHGYRNELKALYESRSWKLARSIRGLARRQRRP